MRSTFCALRFLVVLSLCGLSTSAASLRTTNGELLRGKIVERSADTIVFRSESFGLITVPAHHVEVIEEVIEEVPEVGLVQHGPVGVLPTVAAPAAPSVDEAPPPVSLLRSWLRLPPSVDVSFMVGLDLLRSEVDVDSYMFQLDTKWTGQFNEIHTYHYYEYGKVDGTFITADEHENAARWIRRFGERWILLSQADWLSDRTRAIDYEVNAVAVPAYYLIRSERTTLLAGLGIGHRWERFEVPGIASSSYFNAVAYQLFRHAFNERLTLEQTFLGYLNPEDTDDHSLAFNLTLQQMLTRFLSINLKYSFDYDNTPAPEGDEYKTRTILMMGYRF